MIAAAPLLAAAALALQPDPMLAPLAGVAWEPVHEEAGDRYFLDPASIRRDGNLVRFRLRATFAAPDPTGVRDSIQEIGFDCRARTDRRFAVEAYGPDGRQQWRYEIPEAERAANPIPEVVVNSALFRRICGGARS